MRGVGVLVAVLVSITGCLAIDTSKPPEPGAVRIAGHPYWTMPGCRRHHPVGKWDDHCDVPYVGLPRGFADSDLNIEGPSAAGIRP
jgi:hypothetical protein